MSLTVQVCLCSKEFDLCVSIIRLYQACGMHLHPLEVNCLRSDGLTHFDAMIITSTMLTIGGWQIQ